MAFNLVTGRKGEAHVTSKQFRDIIQGIVGTGTYIPDVYDGLTIEQASSDTIAVHSGVIFHHGCVYEIPYGDSEVLTLPETPTAGVNRHYYIRVLWTSSFGVEHCYLGIVENDDNSGNMQEGDARDAFTIAEVTVTGVTVTITPTRFPKPMSNEIYLERFSGTNTTEASPATFQLSLPAGKFLVGCRFKAQTTTLVPKLDSFWEIEMGSAGDDYLMLGTGDSSHFLSNQFISTFPVDAENAANVVVTATPTGSHEVFINGGLIWAVSLN